MMAATAQDAHSLETLFGDGLTAARDSSEAIVAFLNAVRGQTGQVSEQADALVGAIGGIQAAASAPQADFDPLPLLSMALGATRGLLGSVSALHTGKLDDHLSALGKQTVTMRMISTCLKVEVAQIATENSGFAEFSANYASFSERLVAAVARANTFGSAIARKIDTSRQHLEAEVARQRRQTEVVEQLTASHADAQTLREEVTRTLHGQVEELLQSSRAAIAGLLRCLQFLDAFTQRLDNAQRIMAARSGRDARAAALAPALVCEQMRALLADTRTMRIASARALSDIHDLSGRARQDLADGSGFGTRLNAWIGSQSQVTDVIGRCAADTRVALEHVFSEIDSLDTESATMMTELSGFADLARDFRVVGTNGVVAAAHLNASTGSVSSAGFLARETGVVAENAIDILVGSSALISDLRDRIARLDKQALGDTVARVRAYSDAANLSMAEFRTAKAALDTCLADLGAGLDGLRRACREPGSIEDQYRRMEHHLSDVVAMLERPGIALSAARAQDLDWVWPLYTTDDERGCHTRLFGPRQEGPEAVADDELDDFLL